LVVKRTGEQMTKYLSTDELLKMNEMDKPLELDKYRGSLSPFYNWTHKQEIRENDYLQRALMYDTTDLFLHDLKWRIENNMNFLIVHSGPKGSAKSSNAQSIGLFINDFTLKLFETKWADKKEAFIKQWGRLPRFDVSNICMTRPEFVERVQISVPFETIIFDEDQASVIGIGARLETETGDRFEKCLRSTQINMEFCSPSIEEHVANYYIEAYDKDTVRKVNRSLLYIKNRDGFLEPRSNVKLKYVYLPGYSEKKEAFNLRLKEIQEQDNATLYNKVANWVLDNYVVYAEDDKGNFKQVMKNETIKNIIRRHYGERRFVEGQLKIITGHIDYIVNESRYRKDSYEKYQQEKAEKAEKLKLAKEIEKAMKEEEKKKTKKLASHDKKSDNAGKTSGGI